MGQWSIGFSVGIEMKIGTKVSVCHASYLFSDACNVHILWIRCKRITRIVISTEQVHIWVGCISVGSFT